jgi:hypothetical protein
MGVSTANQDVYARETRVTAIARVQTHLDLLARALPCEPSLAMCIRLAGDDIINSQTASR